MLLCAHLQQRPVQANLVPLSNVLRHCLALKISQDTREKMVLLRQQN